MLRVILALNVWRHFVFYGITPNLHNFSDPSYQPKTTNPKQWQNIVKKSTAKNKANNYENWLIDITIRNMPHPNFIRNRSLIKCRDGKMPVFMWLQTIREKSDGLRNYNKTNGAKMTHTDMCAQGLSSRIAPLADRPSVGTKKLCSS